MNIVQLVGGSGSGKSALAQALIAIWPGSATSFRTNRYLRNRLPKDGVEFLMLPTSVDWPLVRLHIAALARGERVIMPDYDWETGRRMPSRLAQSTGLDMLPTNLLLIETLHLVPGIESVKLFIDAPIEVRRASVEKRDQELSGNFADHFETLTEPGYQQFTAPLRDQSALVLDGTRPLPELVAQTQSFLGSLWGAWD